MKTKPKDLFHIPEIVKMAEKERGLTDKENTTNIKIFKSQFLSETD